MHGSTRSLFPLLALLAFPLVKRARHSTWSSHSLHQSGTLHPHLNSPSKEAHDLGHSQSTKGHTKSGVTSAKIDHGAVSAGRKGKAGKRQVPAKSPTSVAAGKKRALEEAEEDEESMRIQVLRFHAYI